jgi:predicted transposase/invertase (TIGR01784 family)
MEFFTSSQSIAKDLSMSSEVMKKAVEALQELSEDKEARELALMREQVILNREIFFHGAFAEGKTEGKAQEKKAIIAKMLAKGMTPQEIADLLDIPIADITRP